MRKLALPVLLLIAALPGWAQKDQRPLSQAGVERIQREVRHELVTLPNYDVFDNLAFKVDDNGNVTLLGQVTRPTLKSDAESAVRQIEGVEKVNNQIEVLPVSPADDSIRLAAYRAIYGQPPLDRYAMMAVAPIHIIVKNGRITLEGVVNSQVEKDLAGSRAQSIPGAFGVTNNLQVENQNAKK